jgi:lipopolysaccharide export system ATP-binding protein|tara:strand:+ start:1446 stop:2171 length:726 start_codon:yes stop_codon:yes gene_type:complete
MDVLQAEHLAKSYKGHQVVKDVTLSVQSGQVVGLLGPNGAGKTTCFYMIVGSIPRDHGRILFNDRDITGLPMHRRARAGISYLPQEASVFRKLSVADNILAILETQPNLNRSERREKLEHLMDEFQISHLRSNMGLSLSGGERRRVEIARALATEPAFILLDEPFAGIDPITVNGIKTTISQLTERGIGILITDHNVRETLDICEKAYIVSEGQIISEGDPDTILANEQVKSVYLGQHFRM